jgi:hypothetical protein
MEDEKLKDAVHGWLHNQSKDFFPSGIKKLALSLG